jgi:hypothetical protein
MSCYLAENQDHGSHKALSLPVGHLTLRRHWHSTQAEVTRHSPEQGPLAEGRAAADVTVAPIFAGDGVMALAPQIGASWAPGVSPSHFARATVERYVVYSNADSNQAQLRQPLPQLLVSPEFKMEWAARPLTRAAHHLLSAGWDDWCKPLPILCGVHRGCGGKWHPVCTPGGLLSAIRSQGAQGALCATVKRPSVRQRNSLQVRSVTRQPFQIPLAMPDAASCTRSGNPDVSGTHSGRRRRHRPLEQADWSCWIIGFLQSTDVSPRSEGRRTR